jgi:hypothetical protein
MAKLFYLRQYLQAIPAWRELKISDQITYSQNPDLFWVFQHLAVADAKSNQEHSPLKVFRMSVITPRDCRDLTMEEKPPGICTSSAPSGTPPSKDITRGNSKSYLNSTAKQLFLELCETLQSVSRTFLAMLPRPCPQGQAQPVSNDFAVPKVDLHA